jgi:Na+/H+-dicarboxylate symporter
MAISTQSSLASLPVMLEASNRIGAREEARDLVLPMAVALFRLTSPAGNLAVAVYVAHVYGVALDPLRLAAGVVVAALVSLAAVGVASSVTFFTTLVPIFTAMNVPLDLLPLLLPLETLPDFSRTIGNVTADVGITAWASRWRQPRPTLA